MSFFDDDEETAPRPSPKAPRRRPSAQRVDPVQPRRPGAAGRGVRPRRPQRPGVAAADQHTLMVRRGVAAVVAIVVLIVIVLLIASLFKSEKQQEMRTYNREVSALAQESDAHVSRPLLTALTGATSKSAQDVEQEVYALRNVAQTQAARAKGLSAPSEMAPAQQNLLLVMDLRSEGMNKLAEQLPQALGGQSKQLAPKLAGDMEIFLASDVVYSQRVAPLIEQTLASNGIVGLAPAPTRFLANLGWLEPATILARLSGQATSSSQGAVAPGHHGSLLKGVSVGTTALEVEPAVNHLSATSKPTFTVAVEDDGEFTEPDVAVDLTVTAAGKQIKTTHVIDTIEAGKTVNAEIAVSGIPLGVPAKVEAAIQPVPGETNHEGTKGTYLVVLGE